MRRAVGTSLVSFIRPCPVFGPKNSYCGLFFFLSLCLFEGLRLLTQSSLRHNHLPPPRQHRLFNPSPHCSAESHSPVSLLFDFSANQLDKTTIHRPRLFVCSSKFAFEGSYCLTRLQMGMGSKKPEKKLKKIKKCSRELVENGEIAGDGNYSVIEKVQDDGAGADPKAYKSKKVHKDKSKYNLPSIEPSIVVNDGQQIGPDAEDSIKSIKGKSKQARKKKKDGHTTNKKCKSMKDDQSSSKKDKSVEDVQEVAMPDVYQISSGEEDDSKGMKKWIKEFHESRPGLKILQDRIDNFITAHEEQEEQAKRERETKLAEEGWTVVVHRKGGKKTADPESGVAVGSVAEAAVRDKLAKKKSKDVGLDFYRFQRKEAQMSELMKLQSKFQEDKKRIQQLRAARKFKPY